MAMRLTLRNRCYQQWRLLGEGALGEVILMRPSLVQIAKEPHKHLKEAAKATVRIENLILKAFMSHLLHSGAY